jgi:ubiquinone/menaquinone biosynthesis C-methylase UbiE
MNVFDEMGKYWAEIADKNQTRQQVQFLKNQLKPDGVILDLACGSGRHSIALTAAGYGIVGLDVSTRLLRIAKQRCREVEVVRGDMRFLPFKPRTFTSAVCMDTSLGYLPTKEDDLQCLIEARKAVAPSGMLIVDVFNRAALSAKYKGHKAGFKWKILPLMLRLKSRWLLKLFKWQDYESYLLAGKRTVRSDGELLCDRWVVLDKATDETRVFQHTVWLYDLTGLGGLLDKAGFAVAQQFGGYLNESYGANSSRLILVAKTK